MTALAEPIRDAGPVDKHDRRFFWSDAKVVFADERGHDESFWRAFRQRFLGELRRRGFRIGLEQRVPKIIRHGYYLGSYGDLQLEAEFFGRIGHFGFFQELVKENPNGGRYDFDKLQKMPYLVRLRFFWAKRLLTRMLLDAGYRDDTKAEPATALDAVMQRRRELEESQGKGFYDGPTANGGESYNNTDADGARLSDGQTRYFRDYTGHLLRGVVYHNINSMWWVVVNRDCYRNVACFELFTYDPAKHPRRVPTNPERSLERRLAKAVEAQDFERAIGMRDALNRLRAARSNA